MRGCSVATRVRLRWVRGRQRSAWCAVIVRGGVARRRGGRRAGVPCARGIGLARGRRIRGTRDRSRSRSTECFWIIHDAAAHFTWHGHTSGDGQRLELISIQLGDCIGRKRGDHELELILEHVVYAELCTRGS